MKSSLVLCVVLGIVFSANAASVSLPMSSTVELVTMTTPNTMPEQVTENFTTTTTPTTPTSPYTTPCCFETSQLTETTTTPETETTTMTPETETTTTPFPTTTVTCCWETTSTLQTETTTTTPAPPTESQMMCPDGWEAFQGRCYYLENNGMTWPQAQSNCALLGSMLASVSSAQELGFLQRLTQNTNNQASWVGGFYLQDQWLWIDGSWFYNSSFSNLSPDSSSPCLMLQYEGGTNYPCGVYTSSICMKNSNVPLSMLCPEGWTGFQGRCYYYNPNELNWPDADVYCAGLQASLVSVHSLEEYLFLYQQAETSSWLGGFYLEDQWMWLDGSWFYQGFFTEMSQDSTDPCLTTFGNAGWTNYNCDQTFPSFCVKNASV